jgi:hypothetical protein
MDLNTTFEQITYLGKTEKNYIFLKEGSNVD